MNLSKRNYSPPPNPPVLDLVVLQVKVLTETLQTMMQVSFILQQLQMLQMQLAPNPKVKKRKESPQADPKPKLSTQPMSNVNNEQEDTDTTSNPESTVSTKSLSKSRDQLIECTNPNIIQPFMRMIPGQNLNEQYWTETVFDYKANFHLWSKPVLVHDKVNQIEAVWAKRLFLDNNKSVCEQKLYK